MRANRRYIFFDIDGTLLHAHGAGRGAFSAAFEDAFGVPADLSHINFAGATDLRVIEQLLDERKMESDVRGTELFFAAMPGLLDRCLTADPPELLPGAAALLERVSAEFGLGLITGNIQKCAFVKLKHVGLDHYFEVGGYGDDHGDRNEIAAVALQRTGHPPDSVLIGDTPSDIRAAKANGLVSVAVCTGGFSRGALEAEGADYVIDSLEDLETLSRILEL